MLVVLMLECVCYFLTNQPNLASELGIKKRFLDLSNAYIKAQDLKSDTLFIGDSIGRQIFPPNNDERFITTHGGILSAGNYLLVEANIKSNKELKTVIYVTAPFILSADFGNKKTAMNFLKPFFTYGNFSKLLLINKYLLSRPHAFIYLFYFGKFIPFDDINLEGAHIIGKKKVERSELSEFSIHYIEKLIQLCEANNVTLRIISPPIKRGRKTKFGNFDKMRSQVRNTSLAAYILPYLDNVFYWRDNLYTDELHLTRKFIWNKKNRLALRAKMLAPAKNAGR